jgi:hypothetical protein
MVSRLSGFDTDRLKDVYRERGRLDNFRKEECMKKVKEV